MPFRWFGTVTERERSRITAIIAVRLVIQMAWARVRNPNFGAVQATMVAVPATTYQVTNRVEITAPGR
jgi:hypothetical protein